MKFNMRISKPSRKNQALMLIGLLGLATTGTLMATAPSHDANQVVEKTYPVTTMPVALQDIAPELKLFGRVETPRHAQLTAAVTATVNALNVSEGQLVDAGDVLMSLDDADEDLRYQQRQAEVTEAKAALESVRRQLQVDKEVLKHMRELHTLTISKRKRLEQLEKRNLVATETLEDTRAAVARQAISLVQQQLTVDNHPQRLATAEAALHRAETLLAEQELRLSRTVVVAPFRGRVSRVAAAPGDRVREGDVLLEIYDTAALQVRVTLPGGSVNAVKQAMARGETVTARLGDGSFRSIELEQLAARVEAGRSGVDALFRVGADESLELGKAVDVTVMMPVLQQVTGIPVQSLYGDDRVYQVIDGRLQGVQVDTLGRRVAPDGQVQLLVRPQHEALRGEILTTSLPQASTGLKVDVINGNSANG